MLKHVAHDAVLAYPAHGQQLILYPHGGLVLLDIALARQAVAEEEVAVKQLPLKLLTEVYRGVLLSLLLIAE